MQLEVYTDFLPDQAFNFGEKLQSRSGTLLLMPITCLALSNQNACCRSGVKKPAKACAMRVSESL